MSSPVSIFLRSLRLRSGHTQLEWAHFLGCEQGYISALELGIKTPNEDLLSRLKATMKLSPKDSEELELAVQQSARRFTLTAEASAETYIFCNALWQKIERMHPAQLKVMSELLKIDDLLVEQPRYQPTRIRRNSKLEAPM